MADLADVETQLKALIVGWCYPNGTTQPSAVPGNVRVKVARGWPLSGTLQADIAAGTANVTIYSQPGAERLTTRYPRTSQVITPAAPTITATVSGRTITLGGTISAPQNVAAVVNSSPYVYAVQPADTLSTVAAGLASLVNAATPATSSGPVITIPGAHGLKAHVGGFGTAMRELRRQERLFQVTCWCNTPEQRDALAGFLDNKFAGAGDAQGLEFITLPDTTRARLKYVRTAPIDRDALVQSYRRDLIYSVEYATTETLTAPQVTAFTTTVDDVSGNLITTHTV